MCKRKSLPTFFEKKVGKETLSRGIFIVDKAIEFKLGARGLRSIVEHIMIDAMYEMPSTERKSLTITLNYAKNRLADANMHTMV